MNRRALYMLPLPTLVLLLACSGGSSPQPAADFSISIPATSAMQGQSGTVAVNVTRQNGEAAALSLTLSNAPAGITGSGTIAAGATSGTLTLNVADSVATGTYPITASASDGSLTHTASFILTVTPGTNTVWKFDAPVAFFAYQDGTGAWTPVAGSGGTYGFHMSQAKGAVAYVTEDSSAGTSDVVITYGSQQELASRDLRTIPATWTVQGLFSGLNATDTADLYLGFEGYDHEAGAGTGQWVMSYLQSGLHDLIAVQNDVAGIARKVIIHRNINVQGAGDLGTAGTVDFSTEGAALTTSTLTVTGANLGSGDLLQGWQTLETANGSAYLSFGAMAAGTLPIYGVAAGGLSSSDRHSFGFKVGPDDGTGAISADSYRQLLAIKVAGDSLSLTVPAAMGAVTATVAGTAPYARLRTQWAFDTLYNAAFSARFAQGNHAWRLVTSPAYGPVDLTFPDFSALAGWKSAWGLVTGTAVTGRFTGQGRTWTTWPPADGATSVEAASAATVTP